MAPSEESGNNKQPSRPWILSKQYWNDVAKDTVKAACAALAIYLGGVVGGVFKLHIQILIIAAIFAGSIIAYVILTYFTERPGLVFVIGCIIGGITAGGITATATRGHHLGAGWGFLVGVGIGALVVVMGTGLLWLIKPKRLKISQLDHDTRPNRAARSYCWATPHPCHVRARTGGKVRSPAVTHGHREQLPIWAWAG